MDVIDWMDCHCETMVQLEILYQILRLADFSKWPCTKYLVDFDLALYLQASVVECHIMHMLN